MKHALLIPLLLLGTFCAGTRNSGQPQSSPVGAGHGAISIEVVPNPIVAHAVSGNTYDFPFDVVVRETGGHPLTINRVSANVVALGGIPIASESYDSARIAALGYPTSLAANGELRYHFAPRKEVPDSRLFSGVSAELRVDATDDTGTPASATTTVTVRR